MIHNIKPNIDGMGGYYIIFKGSALNETVGNRGTNHMIEHLLCKSFDHLMDGFSQDGINWNASTSSDTVKFYMTGLDEMISKYKHIMTESVLSGGNITQEQFDIEKKIILEEYADNFNDHYSGHSLNLFRKKFDSYGAIGHSEDIKNYTLEQYNKDVNKYYSCPNVIIDVSNEPVNDNTYHTKDLLGKTVLPHQPLELYNGDYLYDQINRDNKVNVICFTDIDRDDDPVCDVVLGMLGDGLNSPLYQEIREKRGLSYFSHAYSVPAKSGIVTIVSATTSKENITELFDTYNMIFNNPDQYFTRERYDIMQGSYRVKLKKDKIFNYSKVACIHDQFYNLDKFADITYEQCLEVYKKYFNLNKFHISKDTDFE